MQAGKGDTEAKLELLRTLRELIPGFHTEINDNRAEELAVALIAGQNERWGTLFDCVEAAPYLRDYVDLLRDTLRRSSTPNRFSNGSNVSIDGQFPLVIKPLNQDVASMARRFPGLTLAYILTKCVGVIAPNTQSEISGPLFSLYAGELQVLTQTAADLDQKENLTRTLDEVEALRNYSAGVTKEVSQLEATAAMLIQNIEAQDKKRRSDWEIEKTEFLSNLRREAEEAARIDASIDLWDTKARSHDFAFRIGATISALLLLFAIGGVIFFGKDFVQTIADQFPSNKQYFGIGLLLLPTLALAWIVRVVLKITLQSLSLSQDARQRHTQILTYLRLLGDSSNPVSPKERVLALSAIFRPLPGQGSDDVSPPTVAELLRDAVNEVTKTK